MKLMFNRKEQVVTTKLEVVYNVLRDNIVSGNLAPGTRLVLKKIAQDLGVSEIPVREAIRMLEVQNFVTMTPHSGAQVIKFDAEVIREIYAIRGVIEGFAARTAIPFINGKVLDDINKCLDRMNKALEAGNVKEFGELNHQFHELIYQQSPISRLKKMIADIWDGTEKTRTVFRLSNDRPREALQEHYELLDAIVNKDGDKVEQLMREHRQHVAAILIDHLSKAQSDSKNKGNYSGT